MFFLSRMDGCVCCDDVDGGIECFVVCVSLCRRVLFGWDFGFGAVRRSKVVVCRWFSFQVILS